MFYDNNSTYVWVFSVGRGLSCIVKLGCGYGIIYDIGRGSDFKSLDFIEQEIKPHLKKFRGRCYAQLILSHPHSDHISQIESLNTDEIVFVTCPNEKCENEKINFNRINNPSCASNLEDKYKQLYANRNPPLQTIDADFPDGLIEYGIYYYRPPVIEKFFPYDNQLYTNSLSLILYIKHGDTTILIPGDITPEILTKILNDESGTEKRYSILKSNSQSVIGNWSYTTSEDIPSLGKLLSKDGLNFLVAPHHGLESGFCEELYKHIRGNKVDLNIISEKRHREGDQAGVIDSRYHGQQFSRGTGVYIKKSGAITCENKYSVSTVNGDHVLLKLESTGKKAVISKDPALLLV